MTDLITPSDYKAIREAIDISIDPAKLKDDTIGLPIYRDAAIRDVLDRDPLAASRTGEEFVRVSTAAVFFCAARLAPSMNGTMFTSLSIQTRDMNISRPPFDGAKRAVELRAMAEAEIAEVLTPAEETHGRPTMFTVATGGRGR